MCGIAGIISNSNDNKANSNTIRLMTNKMSRRGPDSEGFYADETAVLGHRRLAIIDLSEGGRQPMSDISERFVITFNGEIFNYKSVKALLTDYPFRSQSDTEVILAAYIKWGSSCVEYLKGQFAFCIWDKKEKKLFLARDRMGEKPLYYYHNKGVFVFASEIKALLASELVPKNLSMPAVVDYLKYQSVNAPMTILENVYQIPSANIGIFENGELQINQYWDITKNRKKEDYSDYNVVKQKVKTLLSESVQGQMMSDVPLGAFLSGGIDSSILVALMAESSEDPIHTFSVVFNDSKFDESKYSNLIAQKFNTKHNSIYLNPLSLIKQLPDALQQMDAPSGDGLNTYIVAAATKKQGITVAISGLGGDELFAGYPAFSNFYRIQQNKWWLNTPTSVKKIAAHSLLSLNKDIRSQKMADLMTLSDFSLSKVYSLARRVFSSTEIQYLAPQLPAETSFLQDNMAQWEKNVEKLPILSQHSISELRGYTGNVLLRDSDTMGLAHSLEIRLPFFDHNLVEYVLGVPDKMKYSPKTPKKLLVESVFPLLPDEIVYRPKMGFSFPWEKWLRNELQSFCYQSIEALSKRGIFDSAMLLDYHNRFQKGDPSVRWVQIWLLVVLENWIQNIGL